MLYHASSAGTICSAKKLVFISRVISYRYIILPADVQTDLPAIGGCFYTSARYSEAINGERQRGVKIG